MENVIIKFTADTTGLEPAIKQLAAMGKITDEDAKKIADMNSQQQKFNATVATTNTEFNQWLKALEGVSDEIKAQTIIEAAKQLGGFTNEAKKGGEQIKTLKSELRSLKEQIASGTLGEKEMKAATARAAELTDHLGDVSQKIKALSSDTKRIDAVVEAFRGLAAGVAVVQGAMGLANTQNKELEKTLLKVQSAMALLQGVQELANIAKGQGIVKTYALAAAEKAAAVASKVLGVEIAASTALATGGVTLLVAGLAYLVTELTDSTDELEKFKEKAKELQQQQLNSAFEAQKLRLQLLKDGKEKELKILEQARIETSIKDVEALNAGALTRKQYDELQILRQELYRKNIVDINEKYDKIDEENAKKAREKAEKNRLDAEKLAKQERDDILRERKLLHDAIVKEQEKIDRYEKENRQKEKDDAIKQKRDLLQIQDEKFQEELAKKKAHDADIKKMQEDLNRETKTAILNTSQSLSDTLFTITKQNIDARAQAELDNINSQTEKQLQNKRLTEAQKIKIEERAAREVGIIKRNAWKQQQNADISQAIMNGALAISKTYAQLGFPLGIPAAASQAVITAAQVAVIKNQPVPKFAKGVERLNGEGTETSDSIVAMLSKNERVVPADVNNDYFPALTAIHNRKVDHTLANTLLTDLANGNLNISQDFVSTTTIDYDKLGQVFAKNKTSVHVNFDENGINVFQQKSAGRIAYINRKFKLN